MGATPEGAIIPENLRELYEEGVMPYHGQAGTISLQQLAQAHCIPANEPADVLLQALEDIRESS